MRYFILFIVFLFLLSATQSRTDSVSSPTPSNNLGCVTNYDPKMDYFPNKEYPNFAKRFWIEYFLNYKIIYHTSVNQTYVLYQCGTPKPTVTLPSDVRYFSIPLQNISVTETVVLTFIEFLGIQDKIKYLEDPSFVSSPCMQLLGKRGSYAPFSSNRTILIGQLKSVGALFSSQYSSYNVSNEVFQSITEEFEPIQRAEWIKFIAYFFNLEDQAKTVFDGILQRYNCHKDDQKDITIKPRMAWVTYYNSYWDIDTGDYKRKFVIDAGGSLVNSSDPIKTLDELHEFLSKIDFLIDESYDTTYNMTNFLYNYGFTGNVDFNNFPFLKNKQVWRYDKLQNLNGWYDWFESAIVEAGLVLEELIHIMNPNYEPDHPMIWFRNIATGEGIDRLDPSDCNHNPNDKRSPRADLCDSGPPPASPPFYITLLVLLGVLVVTGLGLLVVYKPCAKWSCLSSGNYAVINE